MNPLLQNNQLEIADACKQFQVKKLSAFGSVVRGDFRLGASDVDFLVQFQSAGEPGYADRYMDFAETLERLLGHRVDLLTERSLRNPFLRQRISEEALLVYER